MRGMPWMVGLAGVMGVVLGGTGLLGIGVASGQSVPDYDFDWATVGDVGNAAYDGMDPFDLVGGRGSVDYAYRISKLEITTAQWMEYVNTFSTQSDDLRFFAKPFNWGAEVDSSYTGPGRKWKLIDSLPLDTPELIPVAGLSWRDGARYTNWLHNGKSSDLASLDTGAYDTSTWGDGPGRTFTDDFTHLPGAKFWIPTLDEWLKAAHYDPDGNGPGQGRWWMYPNGTDEPVPLDQTSSGHRDQGGDAWLSYRLGAYPDTVSAYGLLDLSGGTTEWVEEVFFANRPEDRGLMGSNVLDTPVSGELIDRVYLFTTGNPRVGGVSEGFRIVSLVPSPGMSGFLVVLGLGCIARRRR